MCSQNLFAQKDVSTFGFQFKPILTFSTIRSNNLVFDEQEIGFEISNGFGYSTGMIVRHGISKNFSFETGINFISRNKSLVVRDDSLNITSTSDFRLVGYEIPLLLMAFVQLSDEIFMNGALGLSLNFFPSDVATSTEYFFHRTTTRSWIWPGLMANIGWDYRTKKSGIFYFGGSWNSYFFDPFRASVSYERPGQRIVSGIDLPGTYITFDFRYFFHEDPLLEKDKKKKKKKKNPNEVDRLWYRNL